jgi:ABC-2 type transport system permease protein
MTRSILFLFLAREWADTRRNSRVLPLYFVMPLVSVALPVLLAIMAPSIVRDLQRSAEPSTVAMVENLSRLTEYRGIPAGEVLARYILRATVGMFLLMPIAIASTVAAFSIVGEKQQRTLEPILATPITDRQLLLGKLLASAGPTVAATWAAGAVAILIVDLLFAARGFTPPLPDRYWSVVLLVLVPALTAAVSLVTMRLSARSSDPQATIQISALAVLPIFLFLVAVFGRALLRSFPFVLGACALVMLVDLALFRMNVVRFRREEILTRWKS